VVGQTGLGYVAREYGIGPGFVVGGAATVLAIPVLLLLRRLGDPADHIKTAREAPARTATQEAAAVKMSKEGSPVSGT
jgi:hypothetical protein